MAAAALPTMATTVSRTAPASAAAAVLPGEAASKWFTTIATADGKEALAADADAIAYFRTIAATRTSIVAVMGPAR